MSTATPSPATGLVYGDVPNRIIAYIIDAIVLFLINVVIAIPLGVAGISAINSTGLGASTNWVGSILLTAISLAISGVYFIYLWTNNRATVGMRALSLQIGTADTGQTITRDQAIKRWLALGAIFSIAQILSPVPLIGVLIAFLSLGWVIFLIVTTAQSPTKQGWHDKFANTQIVKAAKSAV